MQYKKLGRTGLDISPICIGCMGFGAPSRAYPSWSLDEEASRSLIRHAVEAGVNFFDTANFRYCWLASCFRRASYLRALTSTITRLRMVDWGPSSYCLRGSI
jgi:hypothetical protein